MEYDDLKDAFDSLKRENSELKKRNHMLQKLLEGLPVILTRIDEEGNTIESMGAGLQELGYVNNQLKGQNVFENYPEAKNVKKAIESKSEVSFVGKAANNELVRQFKNYFFPDPEGGEIIGFSLDITDQINVQEKLKDKENFIKHVVSQTPDIIYVFDLDTQKNIFINREISEVLGYTNEELLSMGASFYQKIIHPDDIFKFKERNDEILNYNDEEVHCMEIRAINREKQWRWLESRSTPFKRSSEGKLQQFIAIVRDVTEIKEATQKLQESELFIKQVTEATPDIIYVYDLKLQQYIYFNRHFSEFLGYEESKFKASGNAIHQSVFHPDDLHIWQQRYERYQNASDHEIIEDEIRVKHANGQYVWLFTSAKVFKRNDDGNVWQVLGTARDITNKKHSENTLIATNIELFDTQQSLQKLYNELEERVKQRTLDVEKQREHLYSVFMQAPAGMAFLKGPEHIYELANEHYHTIVGKKELLGKPGRQAIPELESQGIWDIIDKVYLTEEPYFANEMPLLLYKGSGSKLEEIYLNFKIIPVHDINKEIDGVLIHALDITEQISAHLELKRSSKRLKAVFESIPLMAWTALPDGNINYFNQGWYNYTGQSQKEALGYGWQSVFHPEDLVETINLWKKSINKELIFEAQARFRNKDTGDYRWHIVRAVPLRDEKNEIALYVGTCTDIHDQKESEEKFRFLSEFVPQLFWTTGPDGAADYFNQRWYDYSGLTLEQSKDWGWASIMHPEDIPKATEVWTSSIKSGRNYQTEFRIIRAIDGAARWHLVRGIPLLSKEGEVIKWFGTCTDIHDNILARQELQDRNLSLSIINSIGKKISGELDLTKLVQDVTDATTQLSGAEFGAFFYNVIDSKGEFLTLYTVSGVPKENSPIFHCLGIQLFFLPHFIIKEQFVYPI